MAMVLGHRPGLIPVMKIRTATPYAAKGWNAPINLLGMPMDVQAKRRELMAANRKVRVPGPRRDQASTENIHKRRMEQQRQYGWRRNKFPEATRPRPSVCECCNQPPTRRALALDHCHATGAFRGWLCHRCNTAAGLLGDTVEGATLMVEYLKRPLVQ